MMTVTDKMIALLRRLKTEMNGAVAGAMAQRGEDAYGVNYGVSIPTIKDVVCEVVGTDPDHELAGLLWKSGKNQGNNQAGLSFGEATPGCYKQDVRELKLAALFVEDPQQVTKEQMQEWSDGWVTLELAEQSAMQLFWKVEGAIEQAVEWLHTDMGEYRRLGAYYMIGKNAGKGAEMERLLNDVKVFDGRTEEKSAVYALREIYRHNEGLRDKVMGVLERVPAEIAEGVRWQVEYLPE